MNEINIYRESEGDDNFHKSWIEMAKTVLIFVVHEGFKVT